MPFKLVSVKPSDRKFKKWMAEFYDKETGKTRTTHFGDNRYVDYTILSAKKDPEAKERRRLYQIRHEKDLGSDPMSPGVLSFMLLWMKPTLSAAITLYKKLYHM
jgi:hypothetical protein